MRGFTAVAALSALTTVVALNGTAFSIDPTEITLSLRGTVQPRHPDRVVFVTQNCG